MSTASDLSMRQRLEQLEAENQALRARLEDAEQTLTAIREGQVDALVINTPEGERVFSLQGAERPYRALIEQMQEGAVTLIQDGTIHYCNRAFADMLQRPLETLAGSRVEVYVHGPDRAAFAVMFDQCRSGSARGESQLTAADGSIIPVQIGLTLVDVSGQESICMVVTNLSERKRAENVLASAQFMRRLIENAPIGIAVVNRDLRYVMANAVYQAITNDQQITGRTIAEVFPPEVAQIVAPAVQQVFTSGQAVEFRNYETPVHGRSWWNVNEIPLRDGGGRIEAVLILTQDVTKDKLAEDLLRASEERFRTLFMSVSEGFYVAEIIHDGDGKPTDYRYLDVNPAFEQMLGLPREQIIGKRYKEMIAADQSADWLETFVNVARTGVAAGLCFYSSVYRRHFEVVAFRPTIGQFAVLVTDVTERKQAEEAMRESEERFRSVLENSLDCIYRLNMQTGRFEYISPSVEKISGYSPEELLAQDVNTGLAMVHPDDLPAFQAAVAQLPVAGQAEAEYRQRTKSGEYRWLSNHMSLAWDDQCRPLYRHGNIRDITERKQAEAENARLLTEVQNRAAILDATIASMATGLIIYDATGKALRTSNVVKSMLPLDLFFDKTAEERQGVLRWEKENGQPFLPEEIPLMRALRGETSQNVVMATSFPNHKLWISASTAPIRTADGKMLGAVASFIDITQRKRMEESLRQSEARERQRVGEVLALLDAVPTPVIIVHDAEARHMTANLAADKLLGIPHGSEVSLSAPPETKPAHFKAMKDGRELTLAELPAQRAARGEQVQDFEFILVFDDGTALNLLAYGTPLLDEQGRPRGAVHTLIDITQRKRIEDELKAASKAKDNFLAVLSHELRNPLNPVLATATMLRDNGKFDADTREQLDVICRNAEMEARLIDDLLDVTRIERGKIELDRRPVQICAILRRAVEVCMPEINAKSLRFSLELPAGPYAIHADAARLQQVFWNLIKNAVKFTPAGGAVRVRRYPDGDGWVAVEVQDDGEGMDPADLGRIFNAFEQVSRSITRQFGGLGLGLTISKGLVEMHGGTIRADSPGKGQGATFTVRLPLMPAEAKIDAAAAAKSPELPAAPRSLRILLVEDHPDTGRVMRRLLSAKGHKVEIALNVAEALQLAEKQPFDLLLSDLGLPDGSGLDLLIALRAKGLKMPGIALSGYGQDGDIAQSRKAGFAAHMVKPVSLPLLEETMARIVSASEPSG